MKFLTNLKSKIFGSKKLARAFKAARIDRTTGDWVLSQIETNDDIRNSLAILVDRSRDLAKNNSTYRKYLGMRKRNVLGQHGMILNAQIKNEITNSKKYGQQDVIANSIIETAWKEWGGKREKAVSVCGKHTWQSFCNLVDRTFAVDGEAFVRKVKGRINDWGFALQLLDSKNIDVTYNRQSMYPGQNNIIMGIEVDQYSRPVTYYYKHPITYRHTAIPANEIIHIFEQEFADQMRGYPKAVAAILDLNLQDGYAEAELISARVAACQMAVWERPLGSSGHLDLDETPEDDGAQTAARDFSPGTFEIGPKGWKLATVNPSKPGQQVTQFMSLIDQRIANGLEVDYADLSNDVSKGNYSSNRYAALCARDGWKMEQKFLIDMFCFPIFFEWLEQALLTQKINLPFAKYEKFCAVNFVGRRWEALDPLRDIKADAQAIEMMIMSPQDLIRETGRDPEEVLEELKNWKEKLEAYGFTYAPAKTTMTDKTDVNPD